MKNLFIILQLLLLAGCKKEAINIPGGTAGQSSSGYTKYSIIKGAHYSDKSGLKTFSGDHISFNIKFDSTAIYTTAAPGNQNDINKLYGFSEAANNHENSARIGWNWSGKALRLYAYAYAGGVVSSREITGVSVGVAIHAEISIGAGEYLFSVDGIKVSLPRLLTGTSTSGYMQYPYFGGDEVAPHNIYIAIQHL